MFEEDQHEIEQISMAQARAMLSRLPEMLAKDNRTIALTKRGKPVLAVMSWDLYESVIETMDVMGDPEMMDAIREGMAGIPEEDIISMEEVSARLDG